MTPEIPSEGASRTFFPEQDRAPISSTERAARIVVALLAALFALAAGAGPAALLLHLLAGEGEPILQALAR